MADLTAERRLVKSPPELWTELSEVDRLAEHLEAFGEIEITRLEPEHTVAWEGERASGTVSIEAAGWGTRVTLTAALPDGEAAAPEQPRAPEPEQPEQPTVESEPVIVAAREAHAPPAFFRGGLLARLFSAPRVEVPEEPPLEEPEEPAPFEEPEEPGTAVEDPDADEPSPEPQSPAEGELDPERAQEVLDGVLDALGAAHKKPFV